MRILFLTHPFPNFVPDLLLHGFRKLFGPEVVDFPKKESLYSGDLVGFAPEGQVNRPLFPTDGAQVDRDDIPRKIKNGYFDYVFCDLRAMQQVLQILSDIPKGFVIIDGEDQPQSIPPGPFVLCQRETDGSHYSIPLPMALPEELMHWIQSYDSSPKSYTVGFLGSFTQAYEERKIIAEKISLWFKDSLLNVCPVPQAGGKTPEGWLPRDHYYAELQKCRVLLTVRGAGYDTFRFWENAACNAVHISRKMPLFIPNDFDHGIHLFRFGRLAELKKIIDLVLEEKVNSREMIGQNRDHLKRFHTTQARALYLLDRLKGIL
ncbi:MAG: glycosyltransferase [Thermodesulfobacteriota bacterium]